MNILPIDRALSIYGALANRSETKGAREQLSKHLMKLYMEGEKDEHRLTVHGLSYFATSTEQSTPETEQVSDQGLALLGLSLLPQGTAQHDSCFCDANCLHPCLLLFG